MRRSSGILLLVAVTGLTGCRLLDMSLAGPEWSMDEPVLSALEARLKQKNKWRKNRDYDLLKLTTPPVAKPTDLNLPPRWRFDDSVLQTILDRLDRRADLSTTAPYANDYLRVLAAGDDLVAWNAAILLGQRDATFASEETEPIRKLFLERVTYDSQTGQLLRIRRRSSIGTSPKRNRKSETNPARGDLAKSSLRDLIDLSSEPPDEKSRSAFNELLDRLPDNPLTGNPHGKEVEIPVNMQNAAAEAYARAIVRAEYPSPLALKTLVRWTRRVSLPMSVRLELMREAARQVSPSRIPLIGASILPQDLGDKNNRQSRQAAVEACLIYAIENQGVNQSTDFPTRLRLAAEDKLPEIRALYGRWSAFGDRKLAHTILKAQLDDPKPTVRDEALHSYGLLHTAEAKRMLISRASHKLIDVRIASLHGLSQWEASDLTRFLKDDNSQVRREIATVVSKRQGNPGWGKLLQMLLDDPNRDVQLRCIESTRQWRDEFATPVLLKALSASDFIAADSAWKELQKRRPDIRIPFPNLKTQRTREAFADKVAQDFQLHTGRNWPEISGRKFLERAQILRLRGEFVSVLTTLADGKPGSERYRLAAQSLSHLHPLEKPIFDSVLMTFGRELPPRVHKEVLSQVNMNYLHVYRLRHRDSLIRRQAAADLAKSADPKEGATLTPYVAREMTRRIMQLRGRDVYRFALQALMPDNLKEGRELAVKAVRVPFADVQRLACEYYRSHPHPSFGEPILQLMNSESSGVRLAAIRAAGYCRHPNVIEGDPRLTKSKKNKMRTKKRLLSKDKNGSERRLGLLDLMTHSNQQVANEAIFSLVRLDHDAGYRKIEPLTFARNQQVRIQAFTAIGESGRTRFIGHLNRRRDEESSPAVRKAIDLALKKLNARKPRRVESSGRSRYDQGHISTSRDHLRSGARMNYPVRYDDHRLDVRSTRRLNTDFTPPPGRRR